jgi:hypothetical protein
MNAIAQLTSLLSPERPVDLPSRSERLYVAAVAFLGALVCASLWGVAAGSGGGRFALGNLLSVPMLLAVSTVASLPLGLLVFRLTSTEGRATDLVLAHAAALFAGALVLLLLAPLVALYQLSSSWAGPLVAMGTAVVAIGAAIALFVRTLGKLAEEETRRAFLVPVALLALVQLASLSQLAVLAPPVLQERSLFGRGIDGLVTARTEAKPTRRAEPKYADPKFVAPERSADEEASR